MRITLAGGTGFLGQALCASLLEDGHDVTILSRGPSADPARRIRRVSWTPDGTTGPWATTLDGADIVVNLAGSSIADGRWTSAKKQRILDSRVLATRSLAAAVASVTAPPALMISSSAVGYYGPCGDEWVTETHAPGHDYLADVCVKWEAEARRAASARTRVVHLRTGLVLDRTHGALPAMRVPFRLGAGGPVGSGRQYMPWIHTTDWVRLVRHVMTAPNVSGPFNASAPSPVTNAEFARALGRALHRPAVLPTPAFVLKLLLGEMAEALLLGGQRAIPAEAQRLGFTFTYDTLEAALADLTNRPGAQ